MSSKNVREFTTENMASFNEVAADVLGVKYFSFGSKKKEAFMSELVRPGYEIITQHEVQNECDGLTKPDETKWGNYLLTFEHDHMEVFGLNPKVYPGHVGALISDAAKLSEITLSHGDSYEPY